MPKVKILIADHENVAALHLKRQLESLGYQVLGIVSTGEEALQETEKQQPDLVLMDIRLGGSLDGIKAAEKINSQCRIPVIYMIDTAGQTTVRRSKISEPFGYIFKPFDEKFLYPTIEIALFRHKMDKKIKESEWWLNTILNSIGDGVIVIDGHGLIRFFNPVAEQLTGWSREQAIDKSLNEVVTIMDEATKAPMDIVTAWMTDQSTYQTVGYQVSLLAKDARTIPVEINIAPIRYEPGSFDGFVLAFRDITERRQAVQEIRRQANRAEALLTVASRLNSQLDLKNVLVAVCKETTQVLGMTAAGVLLCDEDADVFKIVAIYSTDERLDKLVDTHMEIPRSKFEELIKVFGPVGIIPDSQALEDNPYGQLFLQNNLRTIAIVTMEKDQVNLGALTVISSGEIREFTKDEIAFLKGVADQAISAITNARLFEQMRSSRERLQLLSKQLVDVQEAEKAYLARELHDQIGQVLTGLQFTLESSKRLTSGPLRSGLEDAQNLVSTLMRQIRELSLNLRPTTLDDMGLLSTLLWHIDRYSLQTEVQVHFSHFGLDKRFSPEIETTAYRIIQEALTNVARYAKVHEVDVKLHADDEILRINVIDHGCGFNFDEILEKKQAFGLTSMRERAYLVGGQLEIRSAAGQGTHILADLPLGRHLERRKSNRSTSTPG